MPTLASAMSHPAPRRRHPTQVYRVRQAIVASALVVGGALVWQLVSGGGADEAGSTTTTSTTATTLPPLPDCDEGDELSPQDPERDWATILVDTLYSLPASYGPPDLHNISEAGFPFTDGLALRGFVMSDLAALREGAAANGTPLRILAAYRSYQTQADLLTRRVDELGASEAGSRVARPGHSEHQLGTTIDVTDAGANDVDQSWAASPAGQWIAQHAHEYGFLLSYPAGASDATCYDYEPWHLRYVGRDVAAAVIAAGVPLRQYLWDLQQQSALGTAPTADGSAP